MHVVSMPPSPVKWPKHGDTSKEGAGGRKSALRGSGESAAKVARLAADDGLGSGVDLDSDTAMSPPPVVQVSGVGISNSSAEGQHPAPTKPDPETKPEGRRGRQIKRQ